jgi:hypothetical protein
VWLVVGERPGPFVIVGGAIVLAAVVGHILIESQRRRAMSEALQ